MTRPRRISNKRPKKPMISIPADTHAKVKAHCAERGLTISGFISDLCSAFFETGADTLTAKKEETELFTYEQIKKGLHK